MRNSPLLALCVTLTALACGETPTGAAPASTPSAAATPAAAPGPLAETALPRALRARLVDPPAKRLDVWVTNDAIHLDEGPLFDATAPAQRAQLWPAGRPPIARVAQLTDGAVDPTGLARLRSTLTGSATRGAGAADLQLMAPAVAPYATILQVLGEGRAAGYKRWWIRARGRTATGAFRMRRARWCAEAISAPTPCTITHALITDSTTFLQNRSHTEAACGVPPSPAPPKPAALFQDKRGACKQLKHQGKQVAAAIVPPHRRRLIPGTRCAHATVAAWPTATWTQVVEIADGLRAAGHEMIALSAAEPGETCVADTVVEPPKVPASAASTAAPASAP